jgi:hypothetical protein
MAYWIITVISEFVKKIFHSFVLFDLTLSENDIFTLSSKLKKTGLKGVELQIVQQALLNATGPLCTLHGRLENNFPVDPTSLKTIVEQTLCLVGSSHTQLCILRRKKLLDSINKGKIDSHPTSSAQCEKVPFWG